MYASFVRIDSKSCGKQQEAGPILSFKCCNDMIDKLTNRRMAKIGRVTHRAWKGIGNEIFLPGHGKKGKELVSFEFKH
jgi:hypothetical protein